MDERRWRRMTCSTGLSTSLLLVLTTLLPPHAHPQLSEAVVESLLRGRPQCEALRRAVFAEMGGGSLPS